MIIKTTDTFYVLRGSNEDIVNMLYSFVLPKNYEQILSKITVSTNVFNNLYDEWEKLGNENWVDYFNSAIECDSQLEDNSILIPEFF